MWPTHGTDCPEPTQSHGANAELLLFEQSLHTEFAEYFQCSHL